jgi:hypothetical protein
MKILFIVYHGFSDVSGVSKKIHYQINGLRAWGHEVHVCTYDIMKDGNRVRLVDDKIIQNFGKGKWAAFKKRYSYDAVTKYVINNSIDFVYARSFHNANPFTIRMFMAFRRHGIKSVIEIPTYPYDREYDIFPFKEKLQLKIDKLFRNRLAKTTDAIVTYSDDRIIFGQRTICISNGIELESIPLRVKPKGNNEIHFIAVAEVHFWHGFDRFVHGMGEYYQNGGTKNIFFHIVGDIADAELYGSALAPGIKTTADKYNLQNRIIYHGAMFGNKLNELFNRCDFAVGSLARHRSGITNIKTLKNREYAARGFAFAYSETDSDFDNKPYIFKAPADETPIQIQEVLTFIRNMKMEPSEIRQSITNLTWKEQMNKVVHDIL